MKYLSLFSGIGGFELGITQAYERVYNSGDTSRKLQTEGKLSSEGESIESTDSKMLSDSGESSTLVSCIGFSEIDKYAIQIYQKHFNHKSYGDITKINENELPDFEFLCGGFPCQSFSIAGKRGGFNDTRGTMFFHIARILKTKRPRLLLLENVKGLLSHDQGKTFATIISTLDELGYDLQWQVLNSKNFGVPQNRERVFIVGHLRGTSRPQVFPFRESGGNDKGLVYAQKADKEIARIYDPIGIAPTIHLKTGGWQEPKIVHPTIDANYYKGYSHQRKMIETELSGNSSELRIRRLTPTECARLQGFPDNWCDGISDSQKYKCYGNAVTTNVITAIIEKLF